MRQQEYGKHSPGQWPLDGAGVGPLPGLPPPLRNSKEPLPQRCALPAGERRGASAGPSRGQRLPGAAGSAAPAVPPPPLPAVRPRGPAGLRSPPRTARGRLRARRPRRWSSRPRPGPSSAAGPGAPPARGSPGALGPAGGPAAPRRLCLAGGQNKAETGKGKGRESAAPASPRPSAWTSLREAALQADPDRGQGVGRGGGGGRREGGRDGGREGGTNGSLSPSLGCFFSFLSRIVLTADMCCAYRNKYTSKGTSSWKLFAQKPEPQEVPFASDSRAAQTVPKPGDQQSGGFVAELQIIRVTFSSVHTCSHSLPIFWGRKSSGSRWDRLYLPGLPCAEISKPAINIYGLLE
ncbi:uncharacterized protein J5F26_004014 [Ciconia maguari]